MTVEMPKMRTVQMIAVTRANVLVMLDRVMFV
jgi:hypothetical protein